MGKIENATQWMLNLASDNSHGYDQSWRWGERGDYDCSSAIITAWEQAGVPVKSNGATYTGNMKPVFLRCGFADVIGSVNRSTGAGLQRGDVLLNIVHHTAMYIGGGRIVHASGNEWGGATGGAPGDQTGREVCTRSYYNRPWDCVLRYTGENGTSSNETTVSAEGGRCSVTASMPILKRGMTGTAVGVWQKVLCAAGYSTEVDNSFGPGCEAQTEQFERSRGITDDPNEVGPMAWKAGLEVLSAAKTF